MVDYEAEGKVMPDFNALDKSKQKELPVWAVRQQKVFTNWVNNKVSLSTARSRAAYDDRKVLQGSRAEPICVCLDLLIPMSAARAGKPCGSCNRQLQLCNVQHVQTFASREGHYTEHLCRTQDSILLNHTVLNCQYASLFTPLMLALCKRLSAHVRQSYCTFATQSPALLAADSITPNCSTICCHKATLLQVSTHAICALIYAPFFVATAGC
jgi:hypothetical protein